MEEEPRSEENPYILSNEELTYPISGTSKARSAFMNRIIATQREGIEHGVRPQNIRGDIRKGPFERWKREVWNYWLQRQPKEHQAAVKQQREGGQEVHVVGTRVAKPWPEP